MALRPETHVLGGTYTLFGPPPRHQKRPAVTVATHGCLIKVRLWSPKAGHRFGKWSLTYRWLLGQVTILELIAFGDDLQMVTG